MTERDITPAERDTARPERDTAPAVNVAAVNVAAYWRGDFTLRTEDRPEETEAAAESSLRRLGPSGITVRGRDLAALLAPAYDAFRT